MKKISPGVLAGIVAAALAAPPALAGPTVTVRVEGDQLTLVPRTPVTTTATPVGKDGQPTCDGTSALGALDLATAGDWSGPYFAGLGYSPETIRGETHDSSSSTYWALWVDYAYSTMGFCDSHPPEGADVLVVPDCYAPGCAPASPLRLSGVPERAVPGAPVTVKVEEFTATTSGPAVGATVGYGAATATTGADGTAQLTFSASGPATVQATKPERIRSAVESTCVTTGSDGACGTQVPPVSVLGAEKVADKTAPVPSFIGLVDGQVFGRRTAPRQLRGTVTPDPSGLLSVRLSIVRQVGDRCWAYRAQSERYGRHRCGGWLSFKLGDQGDWSYLLPRRMRRGRYTLRAVALDKAGNQGVTQLGIRVR